MVGKLKPVERFWGKLIREHQEKKKLVWYAPDHYSTWISAVDDQLLEGQEGLRQWAVAALSTE